MEDKEERSVWLVAGFGKRNSSEKAEMSGIYFGLTRHSVHQRTNIHIGCVGSIG